MFLTFLPEKPPQEHLVVKCGDFIVGQAATQQPYNKFLQPGGLLSAVSQ